MTSTQGVKVAKSYLTLQPHGLYSPRNSPGQNTGVHSLSLLQGIFPTQGSNPDLPYCRWILYQLSHKGSPDNSRRSLPRILLKSFEETASLCRLMMQIKILQDV